jgi:hypothetical protein
MARIFQTGMEMGSDKFLLSGAPGVSTSFTRGAWSTYSMQLNANAVMAWDSAVSEFYGGFGFYVTGTTASDLIWFESPGAVVQCSLKYTAGQLWEARKSNGGTLLGTSTTAMTTGVWYWIEYHVIISATVGVFEVKQNGIQQINATAADTKGDAGSATVDRELWVNQAQFYIDDHYVNDTTTATNAAYSGDIRIKGYIPSAAGDVTGMTPTSGANYTNVDEVPPDDATTIVAATGTTLYDLYNIPNTSGVATVQAATLWLRAQKSDAGAKSIAPMIKSGATENQAADQTLSTTWAYYRKNYNVDPTDSAAWTPSKIDNLQIGQKAR